MTAKHDMKKLVEDMYAVRDRGDIEGTLTLIGEGCTFRMVGNTRLAPFSTESSGNAFRQAITQLITVWDLSKIRTAIYVDEDEQMVFAHREGEVRHIPSGVSFQTEFVDKIHFQDGKPVKIVEFVDTLQVAETAQIIQIA
ncbi:ketosteroid isomerase-like protein [Rhizobium leguminosarum]|uniref:Ketosteroid isomerase-like protein n=1 Tax=Rhizobium leguminosarum TaxID=384 RepID=A0AAE2MK74_RHILE|nr:MULTISPECIES: ketosteroid isomerase [Rhizobium]MBB4290632.1 ketosteroid isomerase-like protein [Rhizobium leguminosarum]MBB4297337.1 ketosteroid isomerase-like protein [Rhizobium leguminosarum]MBB4307463.1 ketosteroid isomerase-like protein [Rhizobium leguminosarum]MBB4415237.1 ketosteroid isomerase-like protein [Rhizobium leguminosarum]MBB4431796.1 ketosteroid isomerase-like protein [Rhizobium esperanzae]